MKGYIYKIVNSVNDKYYIGSTNNFKRRREQHFRKLKRNCHNNKYLQASYNKHGKEVFKMSIIKEFDDITTKNLYKEEQVYLDQLSREISYNLSYVAIGGGADTVKQPCYLLELDGTIVKEFDSRNEAAYYLGLDNSSCLSRSSKIPSTKVKSKVDGKRYRVINIDYFEENTEEVLNYPIKSKTELEADRIKANKKARLHNYRGKMLTLKEIANLEGVNKETIRIRIKKHGSPEYNDRSPHECKGEILTMIETEEEINEEIVYLID